jgi:hypothetical protein
MCGIAFSEVTFTAEAAVVIFLVENDERHFIHGHDWQTLCFQFSKLEFEHMLNT